MVHFLRAIAALSLALVGGGAFAQVSASDSAFDRFYAQVTGVGKQTVSYGSGGQLVVGQGVPHISSSGGPVNVERSIPIRNNSGGQIAANARVSVPPSVLGTILRRGLAVVPVLAAGVAIYDVAAELGFTLSKDPAGSLVIVQSDPLACTVAPCYNYTFSGVTASTEAAAASAWAAYTQANPAYDGWAMRYWRYNGPSGVGSSFSAYRVGTDEHLQTVVINPTLTSVPPSSGAVPSSLDAFTDAVAAKSGWPASSRVSQAVADATRTEPAPVFPATPEVTGPSTSTGTTSSTDNPDGSTTTKTTTHNHTYTGSTINTTTTTITSTCTGGSCNTTSEIETPKLDEQPFAMPCGVPGTAPCAVTVDEGNLSSAVGDRFSDSATGISALDSVMGAAIDQAKGVTAPGWTWTMQLPSACSPIPLPAFEMEVDVCEFQPVIHDLMSLVWVAAGFFGLFGLLGRTFNGGA